MQKYPNKYDSENTETFAITKFVSQILPDDKIAKDINFLNSKKREVFNVVHTWARDYVKYDGHDVEPVQISFRQWRDKQI